MRAWILGLAHGAMRPWMVPRPARAAAPRVPAVRACPGSELLEDLRGGGAGCGVGRRDRDAGWRRRGTVRVLAGRRDRHGCLQRDAGVLAAHHAAVNQPAAIRLVLGCGDAWPARLQVRGETTAIAGWPDHNASVALPGRRAAATRGTRNHAGRQPSDTRRRGSRVRDGLSVSGRTSRLMCAPWPATSGRRFDLMDPMAP